MIDQPFAHQGLLFEPELGQFQMVIPFVVGRTTSWQGEPLPPRRPQHRSWFVRPTPRATELQGLGEAHGCRG